MDKCNADAEKDAIAVMALLDTPKAREHARIIQAAMVCSDAPHARSSAARFDGQYEMPWNSDANMVMEKESAMEHIAKSISASSASHSAASAAVRGDFRAGVLHGHMQIALRALLRHQAH